MVAMRDFIVMFGDSHMLYFFEIEKPKTISKIADHTQEQGVSRRKSAAYS
jgi:hypothetical protein